jgi:hypothetical protein
VKALASEKADNGMLKMVNLTNIKSNDFITAVHFLRKKKAA